MSRLGFRGFAPWAERLRLWLRLHNYDVAVRYRPLVRWIRTADPDRRWRILDVGSGTSGIAPFLPGFRVFGMDMTVAPAAAFPLVKGSAVSLPFPDRAWDVVTCVDVVEHLSPDDRGTALQEILRVSRRLAIIAFPFGAGASEADLRMASAYAKAGKAPPDWLAEHLRHPHPDLELTKAALLRGSSAGRITSLRSHLNERLGLQRVHRFLARAWLPAYRVFSVLCSVALPWLPPPRATGGSYRCIFVVTLDE